MPAPQKPSSIVVLSTGIVLLCTAATGGNLPPAPPLGNGLTVISDRTAPLRVPGWRGETRDIEEWDKGRAWIYITSEWRASDRKPQEEQQQLLQVDYYKGRLTPGYYVPRSKSASRFTDLMANGRKSTSTTLTWKTANRMTVQITCDLVINQDGRSKMWDHYYWEIGVGAQPRTRISGATGGYIPENGKQITYARYNLNSRRFDLVAFLQDKTDCDSPLMPFEKLKALPIN